MIAILVIALSTVYGIHRSLGAACQELTDSFYVGVYNASWGTTRPSIDAQLTKRYQTANAMVTLLSSYDTLSAEAEALRTAKNNLHDAASVHDKYKANEDLGAVFANAAAKLDGMSLGERELKMKEQYVSDFNAAQYIIDGSGYNEAVREFYRTTLNVFPTNVVRGIVSDKLPVIFE